MKVLAKGWIDAEKTVTYFEPRATFAPGLGVLWLYRRNSSGNALFRQRVNEDEDLGYAKGGNPFNRLDLSSA